MKYRYVMKKAGEAAGDLTIEEYARREDDSLQLTTTVTVEGLAVSEAAKQGLGAVVDAIRSDRLYPPEKAAWSMAEAVMPLYANGGTEAAETTVDEVDVALAEAREREEPVEDEDEDEDVLDEDEDEDEVVDPDQIGAEDKSLDLDEADDEE